MERKRQRLFPKPHHQSIVQKRFRLGAPDASQTQSSSSCPSVYPDVVQHPLPKSSKLSVIGNASTRPQAVLKAKGDDHAEATESKVPAPLQTACTDTWYSVLEAKSSMQTERSLPTTGNREYPCTVSGSTLSTLTQKISGSSAFSQEIRAESAPVACKAT